MFKNRRKGFTIIELMIVIAIITILALVLIPKAGIGKKSAKETGVTQNVRTTVAVLEKYINNDRVNMADIDLDDVGRYLEGVYKSDNLSNPITRGKEEITIWDCKAVDYAKTKQEWEKGMVQTLMSSGSNKVIEKGKFVTGSKDGLSNGTVVIEVYKGAMSVHGIDSKGDYMERFEVK